jgi:hypothetical protein
MGDPAYTGLARIRAIADQHPTNRAGALLLAVHAWTMLPLHDQERTLPLLGLE